MKKGISLIVLVITIIVLAILAGAIIVSLSSDGNIITEGTNSVAEYNETSAKTAVGLVYADILMENNDGDDTTYDAVAAKGLYDAALVGSGYTVTVNSTTLAPTVVTQ